MSKFQDAFRFCNSHLLGVHDEKSGTNHDLLYLSRGKDSDGNNLKSYKLVDPVVPAELEGKLDENGCIPKSMVVSFKYENFAEKATCIEIQGAEVTAIQQSYKKENFDPNAEQERRRQEAADAIANAPETEVPF